MANTTPIFISPDQDKASQSAFLNENFRRLNDELSINNFDAGAIALGNDVPTDVGNSSAAYSHGVLVDDTGIYALADGQTATDANVRILTDGSASFAGTVTAGAGNIGGFTIGATDLSVTTTGNTTTLSSGATAFSAGPTGSPSVTISKAGVLTATGADISGTLSVDSIDIGGADTSSMHVNTDGDMWLGAATYNIATNPFAISKAGLLRAISGSVGGWTLGATSLTSGATTTTVGIDSGGTNPALYAGSATPSSAPFQVSNTGALTATNATVTGAITATSGSFAGSITATTGDIGGFTIGATDLSATTGGNTTTLSSDINALIAGPTGLPTVTIGQDGSLTATSAVITGQVTTIDGSSLGGQYIVNNSVDYTALDIASFASLSAITANMGSITSGTITMDSAGYIRGGQTDFDTGDGVFLGYSGGDYKFSVGNSIYALLWDGNSLTIKGKITTTVPINLKTYTTATLPGVPADTTANSPAGYV